MDGIVQRIKEIIEHENLNQATFAELANINKSTLSHVLTGRNQPSAAVLQKIIERFPHYRYDWLISGEPPMVKEEYREQQAKKHRVSLFNETAEQSVDGYRHLGTAKETIADTAKKDVHSLVENAIVAEKSVEKIIVYYKDNTFQVFVPEAH